MQVRTGSTAHGARVEPLSSPSSVCTSRIATLQVVGRDGATVRDRARPAASAVRDATLVVGRPVSAHGATGPATERVAWPRWLRRHPPRFLPRSGYSATSARASSKRSLARCKSTDIQPAARWSPEGKPGVAFFVIADGAAVVMRAGEEVATLGPRRSFRRDRPDHRRRTDRERDCADRPRLLDAHPWVFRSIVKANPSIAWKLLQRLGRLVEPA